MGYDYEVVVRPGVIVLLAIPVEKFKQLARRELTDLGWMVIEANSLKAARSMLKDRGRDLSLVIASSELPGGAGSELLVAAGELAPWSARMLITTQGTGDEPADAVLERPWPPGALAHSAEVLVFGNR
jgi:hypothetical protein